MKMAAFWLLRSIVSYNFTDVSEVPAAFIARARATRCCNPEDKHLLFLLMFYDIV
jgi:hypothetical protein